MFKHFRVGWEYAEPIFCCVVSEIFFENVLKDGILDVFFKFLLFIVKNCFLIRIFWVLYKNYSMCWLSGNNFIACWAYKETISSHTESMPNKFLRMLSHCSNLTVFIWISKACGANAERISSLAEHTWKWFHHWLSISWNDFIACLAMENFFIKRGVNCMMGDQSFLRREILVYRGGDTSTEFVYRGGDLSAKGKIRLRMGRLFYGGETHFFWWWNKTVESCPLIYIFSPVKSCLFMYPLFFHVILWYVKC